MGNFILKEEDWTTFVEKNILTLCTQKSDTSCVFALVGDLGAGKTTFSKKFLHQLGVKQHVQSPTFSIINSYDIDFQDFTKVFHIDAYRVEDIKEFEVLHIENIFNNPKHIVVIEWADKVKKLIPNNSIWITFEHDTPETRTITFKNTDSSTR